MIALILYLYIRERGRALARAKQTETILLEQKIALKRQARKHLEELRHTHLEEMRQAYRTAELGHQGITLLHDLANHLTALKLEVEVLENERHSGAIVPTQKIIQHLDDMVKGACKRLHQGSQEQKVNLAKTINETIALLRDEATTQHVKIDWQAPARSWKYQGDVASLCQVIAILIKNAIDAYSPNTPEDGLRCVSVRCNCTAKHFIIRIGDWGKGIPKSAQQHLFEPFYSTKKTGLGLGLYIAKCIMETRFAGTVELDANSDHTEFIVTLPRVNSAKVVT